MLASSYEDKPLLGSILMESARLLLRARTSPFGDSVWCTESLACFLMQGQARLLPHEKTILCSALWARSSCLFPRVRICLCVASLRADGVPLPLFSFAFLLAFQFGRRRCLSLPLHVLGILPLLRGSGKCRYICSPFGSAAPTARTTSTSVLSGTAFCVSLD